MVYYVLYPSVELNKSSYDAEKRPRRVNKLRRPVSDLPKERTSTYSIRLVLKNLCVQFLQCAYNTLMKTVRVGWVKGGLGQGWVGSGWVGAYGYSWDSLLLEIYLLGERSEPHTGVFNRDFA